MTTQELKQRIAECLQGNLRNAGPNEAMEVHSLLRDCLKHIEELEQIAQNADRTFKDICEVTGIKCLPCQMPRFIADQLREREAVIKKLPELFCNLAQLLDGWHNHSDWTDWDTSVRLRLTEAATQVEILLKGTKS